MSIRVILARIPKKTKIIWGTLIALCLGFGIYLLLDVLSGPSLSAAKQEQQEQPSGKAVSAVSEREQPDGREQPGPPATQVVSQVRVVEPAALTNGNMDALTALRADVQLLELQLKKKELMDKLHPPVPVPVPAVVPVSPGLLDLPSVDGVLRKVSSPAPAPAPAPAVVVAVQGVNDGLSAVIRNGGKLVTVRKGQSFGGGVITTISRSSVVVRQGGKTSVLPFE